MQEMEENLQVNWERRQTWWRRRQTPTKAAFPQVSNVMFSKIIFILFKSSNTVKGRFVSTLAAA